MEENNYRYDARLHRIIDGDTQILDVDLGFYTTHRIKVRLLGVDTHETYGVKKSSDEYQKGTVERQFVEKWYAVSDEFDEISDNLDVDLNDLIVETHKTGKFGRWLARIYRKCDGQCLNDVLVERFNVEYEG